jgi:hypothetical protein
MNLFLARKESRVTQVHTVDKIDLVLLGGAWFGWRTLNDCLALLDYLSPVTDCGIAL